MAWFVGSRFPFLRGRGSAWGVEIFTRSVETRQLFKSQPLLWRASISGDIRAATHYTHVRAGCDTVKG